jgi:hypothetical protein
LNIVWPTVPTPENSEVVTVTIVTQVLRQPPLARTTTSTTSAAYNMVSDRPLPWCSKFNYLSFTG